MTNKLWKYIGIIAFWIAWPLLLIYLAIGKRTRVIVYSGDQVLLIKGWLGNSKWALPGGGVHAYEDIKTAATREVREETGIALKVADLVQLSEGIIEENGLRYYYCAFVAEIAKTCNLTKQKFEITDAKWFKQDDILESADVSSATKRLLRLWREQR